MDSPAAGKRLIPTPRELSAGCGLSWAADPDAHAPLMALLQEKGIALQLV